MNRTITSLTLLAAAALPATAAITGQWRYHPTFDNSVIKVIDTPSRAYFIGYPQTLNPALPAKANPDCTLFYFDKEGEEVVSAVQRHDLSSAIVRDIEYNPDKGYLLIIYGDQNIDLLHDDGSVSNVGALMNASIASSKSINATSFDPANDLIWLATDFGYIAINDERMEVAESRNYGKPLKNVMRLGDYIYVITDDNVAKAPASDLRMQLADYTPTSEFSTSAQFYRLGDSKLLVTEPVDKVASTISTYEVAPKSLNLLHERSINYLSHVRPSELGYIVMDYATYIVVNKSNGDFGYYARPDDEKGKANDATWDLSKSYGVRPRGGIREYTRNADKKFAVSRDYMLPNAPNAFYSRNMVYHPRYGMLVGSYGVDHVFSDNQYHEQNLLSAYKDGFWTPMSNAYRNPAQAEVGHNPLGLTIDPADDKYLYSGSNFSGITRLNLVDPTDILHFSHPGDATSGLPGYVKIHETSAGWTRSSWFLNPQFDADNTLWTCFCDYDNRDRIVFRYWTDADRRASKDAASAREWKTLAFTLNGIPYNQAKFIPLRASVNRNLIIYAGSYGLFVLDHNGTPENTSDDTIKLFTALTDQDGNPIKLSAPHHMYEDQQTGVVWISGEFGILYCTPRNLLQGQGVLNRVKVSRNDGTSLADYLLNGVVVNAIARDGNNRMWIATTGAGVVVTSADGRRIYDEFSAENSGLPSNTVYYLEYNPGAKSIMMSTANGLAEFAIGSSGEEAGDADRVRAYPNPVAPDYYGWVTIDGLPDDALVKIVDSKGTIVRELGRAEAGSAQWDINNLNYKRVQTGVYYIMASSASEGGKEVRVGKILVMN